MNVTVQHVEGMRFLATAGSHAVVLDAAPEDGGGDTAMSAPQMFVSALGACILEFVANSCRLRGTQVEQLSVEVAYEEVLSPRRVSGLTMAIRIEPDPPEEVKRRLLSVARHATLANTLACPPEVEICFAERRGQAAGADDAGDTCD
jgi:uncharacterized OsmC-like protein